MTKITIEDLSNLCGYGVHIKILRADNGKVVINGVTQLRNSKDKRQKAKWESFKDKEVWGIRPSVQIEGVKRNSHYFLMSVDAWISCLDCK